MVDPTKMLDWLRIHLVILDEGKVDNYNHIAECVIGLCEAAIYASDALPVVGLTDAVQDLREAYKQRAGVGSAL